MKYNTSTLANGLRVIQLPCDSDVVYCGYQVNAGSRDEQPGEEGLAHFCEHMTFKGTARRSAWNILNSLERFGGDINAYTNKESTVFYAAVPREAVRRAIDLLTDIVFRSTYPQREIDKEVEVICDEIESYNDSPAELIYDDFEDILFRGHPLGHNILGTAARVRSFTTADALRFTRRHYRPDNAVFFIYGSAPGRLAQGAAIPKLLQKAFDTSAASPAAAPAEAGGGIVAQPSQGRTEASSLPPIERVGDWMVRNLATHQAHVMVGARAYAMGDDRRMALWLLNNILGGPGMNSRLNVVLREHRGLVYTVDSSMVCYSDTGLWCTYLGCDYKDVGRCLRLVRRELDRLMAAPLSARSLSAAKRQLKGQVGIACDNRENFALDFGRSFLFQGWERDIDELYSRIDAVTAEEIQHVAAELFAPGRLTVLVYK